ncbi:PQQ-binding-like beta-propeller repeat protein [Actinoplanes sp. TFC3]|uniref:outer membrane protein assembly factor BamB family protein n=1 Tax=Actinoplanes sp. TFC3 TaxID=1710355 RepID=UPI000836CB71|nr:PQQ-binding-like beta-propeller repeat protein [Actinoplanes sp. TFC3]
MALIELSPGSPARPVVSGPPPAYVYRRLGLIMSVILLLALGGAAPQASLLWQHTAHLGFGDQADFVVGDARVYAVDFATVPPMISAWSAADGRQLWRQPGPPGGTEGLYSLNARTAGLLVVNVRQSATVLDAATGSVRWNSPTPLQPLDTHTGLVTDEQFRPGTEYDPDSGEPGRLYGTTSEVLHTEPALSTTLRGVDLATGRELWSATVPGSVSSAWTGSAVVTFSADRITLRSATTGKVLHERVVEGGGSATTWGETAGDTLLVHYGAYGESGRVVAYSAGSLAERWSMDQPDSQGSSVTCTGLPCRQSRTEVSVLDPATGAVLWRSKDDLDLMRFGAEEVFEAYSGADPKAVVDRRTGTPLLRLDPWTTFSPLPRDNGYLLTMPDGDAKAVALLLTGSRTLQPLGRVPAGMAPCLAGPAYVACRAVTGVEVYRYLR